MPFIHDNNSLLIQYREIENKDNTERKETNRSRFDDLMAVKDGRKSHVHSPYHCIGFPFRTGSYNEIEWTMRLFHSFKDYTPDGFQMHLT